MAQTAQTQTKTAGLESIDRLEDKIKLLVTTIGRIKGEQARVAEENSRLKSEIETLKGRVNSAESAGAEVTTLREERDLIKSRVSDMLKQLDPRYVEELAQFVEARMALALRSSPSSDAVGLAILTALNITDEFFRARSALTNSSGSVTARAEAL